MGVRFAGVDAARGLAILGMLWAHTAADGTRQSLADGRSAVLFATLAGVSIGLITGGDRPREGRDRVAALLSVALRGVVLVALGLLLWTLGTPIAVVLDTYGVLFLLLLPLVFAPLPVVAGIGAVAALGGPLLVAAVGPDLDTPFTPQRLAHLPAEWTVTGYYPAVVYAAYCCAGLVAARAGLGRRRVLVSMICAGAATSLLGYGGAALTGLDASAHSDTTAEVLGAGGLAVAVVGTLELLCSAAATGRIARIVLAPLSAAGRMPLTIYTGQLLVLAVWLTTPAAGDPPWIESWTLLAGLIAGSLLFAVVWQRFVGRGPMEGVLARVSAVRLARG
ncbi:DUF418 domain-containing protein [Amnibacterium kyonggiense]|uniref:Uncharacterized protein DUF418 n=1 Tax=Amnibacterium kyonggiense TaxID=595671 RepID=A0A4R7FQ74_9MICO|nr:DUF418 domain-containing protein [Amnibacterium kyonggiense]TDS79921.1 uncharacterized protein DUF418 [Amnibacterium kyonggiense]